MSLLDTYIKDYKERLNTMKENRANEMDHWNDAENELADKQINLVAEFLGRLGNLKPQE